MQNQSKVTETRSGRTEWKRPEVRQMAAGQAETAPTGSVDSDILS
jgi:hypothetical protein